MDMSALLLCVAVAIGLQCVQSTVTTPTTAFPPSLSLSMSSFGTSLYKHLASEHQDNIIFSPLSVYTALAMTLLGAGGETKQELMTTLAVKPGQNVHSDLNTLRNSMITNDAATNLTLLMYNALYYNPVSADISQSYHNHIIDYYGTDIKPFQTPNPEQAINTWVEDVTGGKTTNFLQPGAITTDTVLMLLHGVFFEASWMTTFNPTDTHDKNFTTISGIVKQVPLMYEEGRFSVKNEPELKARVLELPYVGGNYSLFIILPNTKTGLTDLETKLTGQILEDALSYMPVAKRRGVYIPKLTLRMRSELNEPLEALGLNAMFDGARANFSGMSAQSLVVSEVLHEAMIEVTESGTKATAVTSVKIVRTSASIPDPRGLFKADHPFLFVLRDKFQGVNLFMGRVTDPPVGEHRTM